MNLSKHFFINLKVASLNCRGLNDDLKRHTIFENFKKSNCTIICLQETKLHPENEYQYLREWDVGPAIFNSVRGGRSGSAILFNTHQVVIKKFLLDNDGRIISLDIDIDHANFHIVNTYFPNRINEQYQFIGSLHPFFYTAYPTIWAGDQNISTDNITDRFPSIPGGK